MLRPRNLFAALPFGLATLGVCAAAHADPAGDFIAGDQVNIQSLAWSIQGYSGTSSVCLAKAAGSRSFDVSLATLGIPNLTTPDGSPLPDLHFEGAPPTSPNEIDFSVDQTFTPPLAVSGISVDSIRGTFRARLDAFAGDAVPGCGTGFYNVSVSNLDPTPSLHVSGHWGPLAIPAELVLDALSALAGDATPPQAPAALASVWLPPLVCRTGQSQSLTGRVTLTDNAHTTPFVVSLSASSPDVVVPASVTVPSGATTATFTVTLPGSFDGAYEVDASAGGITASAQSLDQWTLSCMGFIPEKWRFKPLWDQCLACGFRVIDDQGDLFGTREGGLVWSSENVGTRAVLPAASARNVVVSGVTASGTLVGSYFDGHAHGFLLDSPDAGGTFFDLDDARLVGTNLVGESVGMTALAKGGSAAFLISGQSSSPIAGLGGSWTTPVGINQVGQVAGTSQTTTGQGHAFRYAQGKLTDLGDFGGGSSVATAIGDDGVVVGYSLTKNGTEHALAYGDATGLVDLGVLPGFDTSRATAYGANGLVVGTLSDAKTGAAGNEHAFASSLKGPPHDLNDDLDPALEAVAREAVAVNRYGAILVRGEVKGQPQYFVLEPVLE